MKWQKHAEVLRQMHATIQKKAEAQKNISGAPGEDVKSHSISDEHENVNKNAVGPENVVQGVSQKPSEDSSTPVKISAEALGAEVLDVLRKASAAQDKVDGALNTNDAESTEDKPIDKNKIKPENNAQKVEQKGSTDDSKPVAKTGSEVDELAAKVASYELGRQFCASLLKAASTMQAPQVKQAADEAALLKEAGRRDFDVLIAQAAADLEETEKVASEEVSIKEAELAGASHFDELLKQASLEQALAENEAMRAKLAEYSARETAVLTEKQAEEQQAKLAAAVAATVIAQLKAEQAPVA
jgi:hypothetical protein